MFPGGEPQRVVLEFDRAVATIVLARRYHASQRTKRLRDGRVRMELDLTVTPEVVSWVVGWGPMVRVVASEAFAENVEPEHRLASQQSGGVMPDRRSRAHRTGPGAT